MRLLILSDIHANLEALEACLAAAPVHDRVVNLGDVVGYGASPNEVTDIIRDLGSLHVRGNHDKACSGVMSAEWFNQQAAFAVIWTRDMLTFTNRQWLREMPQGPIQDGAIPRVTFCHGTPIDEDEYMMWPGDALTADYNVSTPITFFGHTHIQGGFAVVGNSPDTLRVKVPESGELTIALDDGTHYLVNPGSVGQPRDGDNRAGFALFDTAAQAVTFYRVPYDFEAAARRIRDAELPERLATRLAVGR